MRKNGIAVFGLIRRIHSFLTWNHNWSLRVSEKGQQEMTIKNYFVLERLIKFSCLHKINQL